MEYGTDRMQEGDRNFSETNDTDKRNTYAGGLAFVFQPNKKHKLMLNTSVDALNRSRSDSNNYLDIQR